MNEIENTGQTEVSYLRSKITELKVSLEAKDREIKRLKEEMKGMIKFIPRDITETSWTTTR